MVATLALALASLQAGAAELPGQGPKGVALVTSCTVETDSSADPADAQSSDDDDEEEDGSSDGDDDETSKDEGASDAKGETTKAKSSGKDDDEPMRGFFGSDGVTCIGIAGTISAATAVQAVQQPPRMDRLRPIDNFDFATTFSLDVDSSTPFGDRYLTTGFSMTLDPENDPLLTRATIGWGPWLFGYDSSQFTFWDGGDFAGSALSPQQSSTQIMRRFDFANDIYGTLSLEAFTPSTAGQGSQTTPSKDLPPAFVAALGHEGERLTTKLALFARAESEGSNGVQRRAAFAANAGVTWDFASGASLTAQASVAANAPELLGTRFERRNVADLGLEGFRTLGWSGVVAGSYPVSDTLTANAYLSFFRFKLDTEPKLEGDATSWRMAANLSWEPVERLTFALEAGASLLDNRLALLSTLSGERKVGTLTLTIQRQF